jgi:SAM-dependent methyltransferase
MKATYFPEVFDVANLDQAKQIILTSEHSTTAQRWETETPYVAELICQLIKLGPTSLVLDYGCGIGRMAKELIARQNCCVIGVDISASMRALAPGYVASERFVICSPGMIGMMVRGGLRFDAAIAIWVLQHCLNPADDINFIKSTLKRDADLFVLNNIHRAVPIKEAKGVWANDQKDIGALLGDAFTVHEKGKLAREKLAPSLADLHFCARYKNNRG